MLCHKLVHCEGLAHRENMPQWLTWPRFQAPLHNFPHPWAAVTHCWTQWQHQMHFHATLLILVIEMRFNVRQGNVESKITSLCNYRDTHEHTNPLCSSTSSEKSYRQYSQWACLWSAVWIWRSRTLVLVGWTDKPVEQQWCPGGFPMA